MKPYKNEASTWFSYVPFTKDIKARAHVQNGEIDSAIVEYKKLMTHNPKNGYYHLIHPKYHYRLAKLYQKTNQTDKAIKEYVKFLDLWKHADPDYPELSEAGKQLEVLRN
jgi:tetratricopeptide (TPR) repeat protein